jgi:asparagine synthase (glutamine-hydrolysing)
MCRIAGIFNPADRNISNNIVMMRDAMRHGGPDDAGVFLHEVHPIALGHRRLSLIDLSENGHQPMQDPAAGITIVYNGEIYNYRELKATLQAYGHSFMTETDTEVVIKSYLQWGNDAFELFNGMFALAIWDEKKSQLILARDHAGMKPLYYAKIGDAFCFASEMRAFAFSGIDLKENEDWPVAFLAFGHLPEPMTTLKQVTSLEKGTVMTVDIPTLHIRKSSFFKWHIRGMLKNEEEAILVIRNTLKAAVERHLISDAPLGIFLSGGIDSSLLTLLAAEHKTSYLKTLSITFKEKQFSEEKYQNIIVQKAQTFHGAYEVSRDIFNLHLEDALIAMDQPSIDGINTYFISKFAREHGLKAVLSGVGADELFGGYPTFQQHNQYQALQELPNMILRRLYYFPNQKVKKISYAGMHHSAGEYLLMRGLFDVQSIADLLGASYEQITSLLAQVSTHYTCPLLQHGDRISWFETNYYMQNQLLKDADCMGMWHGLEIRMPFLDKEWMLISSMINASLKFKNKKPKHLLVKAFMQQLPEEIWNRKKQGFTFPFEGWLKENEYTQPVTQEERSLYNSFQKKQINWSRYWCALMMNRYSMGHKAAA